MRNVPTLETAVRAKGIVQIPSAPSRGHPVQAAPGQGIARPWHQPSAVDCAVSERNSLRAELMRSGGSGVEYMQKARRSWAECQDDGLLLVAGRGFEPLTFRL